MSPGSEPASFDTFEAAGRRAVLCAWVERRLFEVVGGWVPSVPEPPAKLLLRSQSFGHAGRAERWQALVPVSGPPLDRLAGSEPVDPEGSGVARVVLLLDALSGLEATPARVAGLSRVVLPWLLRGYAEARAGLAASAGAPERRLLVAEEAAVRSEVDALECLLGGLSAPHDRDWAPDQLATLASGTPMSSR